MHSYVWAAVTIKDDSIDNLKVTYKPQLFVLANEFSVRFGFCYGSNVDNDDPCVTSVKTDQTLSDMLASILREDNSLKVYANNDGETARTAGERVPLIDPMDITAIWSKDSLMVRQYSVDGVPDTLSEEMQIVLGRMWPFFERLSLSNAIEPPPTGEEPPSETEPTGYSIQEMSKDTGYSVERLETMVKMLLEKKQVIFQGPPGTGKTYLAEKIARHLASTDGSWDILQFHPAYSYEDFMQGIRPVIHNNTLSYEMKEGKFLQFCDEAEKAKILSAEKGLDYAPRYILIIDEINRANLSRVLGELLFLLEYRDKEVLLASGERRFQIPENVLIIGTMNTADRSIALVDYALRRRFSFITLRADKELVSVLRDHLLAEGYPADDLIDVLEDINTAINEPNYSIGVSYFMNKKGRLKELLPIIWVGEIEPMLEEFFYNQRSKVEPFRWEILSKGRLSSWTD